MMARKFKQYKNPFLKSQGPHPGSAVISNALPNLGDAIALHHQGQLEKAQEIYTKILNADPKNADALHLLGVMAHQRGMNHRAVELISQAIEINHTVASFHANLGIAHHYL